MRKFEEDLIFTAGRTQQVDAVTEACPVALDMRDLVLKTEDQGSTFQCAAYTATSWVESIMWRRTGKPVQYDPQRLYARAKEIDGLPDANGTTLTAVLESALEFGWLPGFGKEDIRYINDASQLKRAVHRYGTCLLGFNISSTWRGHFGKLVLDSANGVALGGHAVICTGYNKVGCFIQNSWGKDWGRYGFAVIPWDCFDRDFRQGAYIRNCLNNLEE